LRDVLVTQTLQLHFHTLVEPETLQITTCLLFGVREE